MGARDDGPVSMFSTYTSTAAGDHHRHVLTFDEEGNGKTNVAGGHYHKVRALELSVGLKPGTIEQWADDWHTHDLTACRAPGASDSMHP